MVLPTGVRVGMSTHFCAPGPSGGSEPGSMPRRTCPGPASRPVLAQRPEIAEREGEHGLAAQEVAQASGRRQPSCSPGPVSLRACSISRAATWPGLLISGAIVSGSNQNRFWSRRPGRPAGS